MIADAVSAADTAMSRAVLTLWQTSLLRRGRPTVIDARITRWALPHYSPSPEGVVHGVVEALEARFRGE